VLPEQSFDDFTVETEVLVDEANTASSGDFRYGLAIRRSGKQYYAFAVSPRTHTWHVLKSSPTGLEVLDQGSDDSIRGLEALDTLRVDANGPAFTFYVNGRRVTQVVDAAYATGAVGFFVETFDSPRAHIHYDSLAIHGVEPPAPAPQLAVLFEDAFTDLTSGWPDSLVFDNYYVGYHEPEWYHVEVRAPDDRALVVLPDQSFNDFSVETAVLVEPDLSAPAGDFRYGLAVRRTGNRFYAFAISPRTKAWFVLKSSPSGLQVLDEGQADSIQGLEASDTLRVDAQGTAFTFHINGRPVSRISDAGYAEGAVGFFVETFDSPRAHIHYDSLAIRGVEPPAPAPQLAVLFEDAFTDLASGWPDSLVFDNYYVGYHEPEWYHVEVREPDDRALVVLPDRSFDDFSVETAVLVEPDLSAPAGDFRYGLVVRRTGNRFYAFAISPRTKAWFVLKSSPSGLEVLNEGQADSIQGLEASDTLRVDAEGTAFTFYINGRRVTQVSDTDYIKGELGFFVETFDSPRAHIHYDSLIIRGVPEAIAIPGTPTLTPVLPTLTPTRTLPTPTPTPPASSRPEPLCTVVAENALNLRSGPGIAYAPPIATLPNGTRLEPLARSPDVPWIQVRVQGSDQIGWVSAAPAYISCNVPMADLPVSELPPSPTTSAP
jgi:hypothetical protein